MGTAGVVGFGMGTLGLATLFRFEPLGWFSLAPLLFGPILGTGLGVWSVSEWRHGQTDEHGFGIMIGTWLGAAAGLALSVAWLSEDDSFGTTATKYYTAMGGAALTGAILGYHLSALHHHRASDHNRKQHTVITLQPYVDRKSGDVGAALNWGGAF